MNKESRNHILERRLEPPLEQHAEPKVKVKPNKNSNFQFPIRYLMCFLAFLGFVNMYFTRANFSVAIVEMVAEHNISTGNGTFETHQDFVWNTKLQGVILSSFFWGYVVMQIPSGLISSKFGGQKTFGIGLLLPSIFTLLTPISAKVGGYWWIVVLRILEGITQAVTFPAMIDFWSKWAPTLERTKLVCTSASGVNAGILVSMPVSGFLAAHYNWESIFYVSGTCGVIWTIIWFICASETPESNRFIGEAERRYIVSARGVGESTPVPLRQVPWKRMFSSVPLYALFVAQFSSEWGFYTIMTELPTYMKQILKFDIQSVGFTSGLPFLALTIVEIIVSNVVDVLRKRGCVTTTNVRRACAVLGLAGQAVFIFLTGFTDSAVVTVAYFTLAAGFGGVTLAALDVNMIDLAPRYSAILMGLSNCIGNVPGIASPILTGFIVRNKTLDEWRIVFYLCSSIYAVGAFVFGIFGSGEPQSWSQDHNGHLDDPRRDS